MFLIPLTVMVALFLLFCQFYAFKVTVNICKTGCSALHYSSCKLSFSLFQKVKKTKNPTDDHVNEKTKTRKTFKHFLIRKNPNPEFLNAFKTFTVPIDL